jgi:hypothetical protein
LLLFRLPLAMGLIAAYYPSNLLYIILFILILRFPQKAMPITIGIMVLTILQTYVPWYQHFTHHLPVFLSHQTDIAFFSWAWLLLYQVIYIMAKTTQDNDTLSDAIFDYGQILFFLIGATAIQQMF